MAVIFLCAFRSSDCHGAPVRRVIEPGREFYVCGECDRLCEAVADAHDVRYTSGAGRDPGLPDQGAR